MTRALAPAALLALAGCAPSVEGEWTGQCLTDAHEARVRLHVYETRIDEDPVLVAEAIVHLAERTGEALYLVCDWLEVRGPDVVVDDCSGSWSSSEDLPVPWGFSVDGVMEGADPTDTLRGTCTFEEHEGALDLVRTP